MRFNYLRILTFLALSFPFIALLFAGFSNQLGPDPAKVLAEESGEWALMILLLTLAATPLARVIKMPWPVRLRRMLGLFAFFYVVIHLLVYLWLFSGFDLATIVGDLTERPYIIVGFIAFLLMVPLAVTSTHKMRRRLRNNWSRLHKAIYLVGGLALVHVLWQVRSDLTEAIVYVVSFCILMLARCYYWYLQSRGSQKTSQ